MGLDTVNLHSTVGAYLIGLSVLMLIVNFAMNFRPAPGSGEAGNIYGGGTLEWLPAGNYGVRSMPIVDSREPLWDNPAICDEVEQGRWFLRRSVTNRRETIVSSAIKAIPQYVMVIPGPSWLPLLSAVFTAAFFLLLTFKLVLPAALCAIVAVAAIMRWLWQLDHGPDHPPVEVGGGLKLPIYKLGSSNHGMWAMAVLATVLGMIFASMVFGYFYLWSVQPDRWPPPGANLPSLLHSAAALGLYGASFLLLRLTSRMLARHEGGGVLRIIVPLVLALSCFAGALTVDLFLWWEGGVRPAEHSFGASIFMMGVLTGQLLIAVTLMVGFAIARLLAGRMDRVRRLSFDTMQLLWIYALGQGAVAVLVTHFFPRLVS